MSKSLKTLIRLAKRELDELSRQLMVLQNESVRLERLRQDLIHHQIHETQLYGVIIEQHPILPLFLKQMSLKQQHLTHRLKQLDIQMISLKEQVAERFATFKRYELLHTEYKTAEKLAADQREQNELDEVATMVYRQANPPLLS